MTIESMSSVGLARFSAMSVAAVLEHVALSGPCGIEAGPPGPPGASPSRMSNVCSTADSSSWRSDSGMPSRMQIVCSGISPATSCTTSNVAPSSSASSSSAVRRRSSTSSRSTIRRVSPVLTSRRNPRMARVIHHVQHDARDRQVGQQRAAVGTIAAAFGRIGLADRVAPGGSRRRSPPTRNPRRRACGGSARASRRAPPADGGRRSDAGSPARTRRDR